MTGSDRRVMWSSSMGWMWRNGRGAAAGPQRVGERLVVAEHMAVSISVSLTVCRERSLTALKQNNFYRSSKQNSFCCFRIGNFFKVEHHNKTTNNQNYIVKKCFWNLVIWATQSAHLQDGACAWLVSVSIHSHNPIMTNINLKLRIQANCYLTYCVAF